SQTTKAKESLAFKKKLAANLLSVDFQEYLLTSLLLLCKKAQFLNLPLEQLNVPKPLKCDQLDYTHFQKKPVLLFKFAKTQAEIIRNFMFNLDNQAQTFDIQEKQNFQDSRFSDSLPSRNAYLNH